MASNIQYTNNNLGSLKTLLDTRFSFAETRFARFQAAFLLLRYQFPIFRLQPLQNP